MKQKFELDLKDIDGKVSLIKEDPVSGLEFVVDFLFTAHEAWCKIIHQEPQITKEDLWLALDLMNPEEFSSIMNDGLARYSNDDDQDQDKKKLKTPRKPSSQT